MKYIFSVFLLSILIVSCSNDSTSKQIVLKDPNVIINRAIRIHGSEMLEGNTFRFDFRGRHYRAFFNRGQYVYARSFEDSTGQMITDILSNRGLYRKVNGTEVSLTAKDSTAYAESVNSVIYFALLPVFLNDAAVNKELLEIETINEQDYYKIKVTFDQNGGGNDFQDEYIYWFHTQYYSMDYLAYNYQVNGGGARFREAFNERSVAGLRIADYNNYKPKDKRMDVENFGQLFMKDSLELLSKIELDSVELVKDIE